MNVECPFCGGDGTERRPHWHRDEPDDDRPCTLCRGTGSIPEWMLWEMEEEWTREAEDWIDRNYYEEMELERHHEKEVAWL